MRILLIKLKHYGDTLLMTPAIRAIHDHFPQAQIDVMVRSGCEVMLQGNPAIAHIIPVAHPEKQHRAWRRSFGELVSALKIIWRQRYDYAFDLSNSDRAKLWVVLSRARYRAINSHHKRLGWKSRLFNRFSDYLYYWDHQVLKDFRTITDVMQFEASPGPLEFHGRADADGLWKKLPDFSPNSPYAVIHPTSRWSFKQWLPERWAEVADQLSQSCGLQVVLSSGPGKQETEYIQQILKNARGRHWATLGKASIMELAMLMKQARLFLGIDTMAMHLAAAMQVPIVALFGPTLEASWHPWQCPYELVLGACVCKKNRKVTCDKNRPYKCMAGIEVKEVLAAAEKCLNNKSEPRHLGSYNNIE